MKIFHSPKTLQHGIALAVVTLASCTSSSTEPHAMTAAEHQAAGRAENQASLQHQKEAQDAASQRVVAATGPVSTNVTGVCPADYARLTCFAQWTSFRNPTEEHLAQMKRHRDVAQRHRKASKAMRDAEARACINVPDADRDISPFFHREDIKSAAIILGPGVSGGGGPEEGARVVFSALPGMTAEWLQRVVDCHLARNAVIGDAEGAMSYCPLAVPHVTATVTSVRGGFDVSVRSSDERGIKEVIRRVTALSEVPARRRATR